MTAVLCIGHRGAAGHAPENTVAAVLKGIELGADWIEVDLYCVEDQLIVFHDDRLERTTNGTGLLMDHSFQQLRSLDAGNGDPIPTLQEIIAAVTHASQRTKRAIGINLELKGPQTAEPVAQFLLQHPIPVPILVSSFDHGQLQCLHNLSPRVAIGLLFGSLLPAQWEEAIAQAQSLQAQSINLPLDSITPSLVTAAHRQGLQVWVYTVNQPEDLERMRSLQVDAVFTDYPDRCLW